MNFKLLIVASFLALASCKQNAQTVMIVGDSWASYFCYYKSFEKALKNVGITDAGQNNCAATALVGVRADEWMQNSFHRAARLELRDPSVKVLVLSIGGNDILNYWNKNMTAAQENAVFDKVFADTEAIIKDYQSIRPDIKILLSGYDFPRFFEDHPIKEYREAFEEMGKPTPYELNSAVVRYSQRISKIADNKNIFYIQHYGLMHYYRGNSDHGLEAERTIAPEFISSPSDVNQIGGDVRIQSDKSVMFQVKHKDNVFVTDAFHLNRFGYDKLAEHTVYHYLKDWLTQAKK